MDKNWEVELKYHVDDVALLQEKLNQQGFTYCGREQHEDTYFRHPCRDFRVSGEAFRLRMVNDAACLTYKGPRVQLSGQKGGEVKTRPEIELSVGAEDQHQWRSMLANLGFTPVPSVRKTRQIFSGRATGLHAGITVAMDTVEQLGEFAEIEILVAQEADLTIAQQRIIELGKCLGLFRIQQQSYLSQLLNKLGIE